MFINTGKRFQSCLSYKLKEIRWVSTKSKKEKQKKAAKEKEKKEPTKKYTDTINLPNTKFPVWVRPAQRSEVDEFVQKVANFSELYSWQREHLKNNEEYVLHDGPPYANGLPHMGHAINKILKDITIRSKLLQGYKINYRPGWDCHGLPIELLAVSNLDQTSNKLSQIDIREKARKFANEAINNQRAVFQSWGVMADWSNDGCYFTFDKDYIKNELTQFYNLYEKGLIYRDFKPVYWSPSSKTALAEAELEYNADHKSTSVTLAVKLQNNDLVKQYNNGNLYALLWTTTPWTLPANQAVAFNPLLEYSIIQISGLNNYYILATKLIEDFSKLIGKSVDIIKPISVEELSQLKYQHPLNHKNEFLPILPSSHVTADKGTGLVHTACAHGQDDFIVGKKNGFKIESIVDEEGKYVESIGSDLAGLDVLSKECTYKVLSLINKDCILNVSEFKHSYPYDWRTKKPVILRASQQWFIDTDEIKQNALDALKDVTIVPEKSSSSFLSLLERRPYWCISRQRSWGVPIPVLYNKLDGTPIISRALIDHYCTLLDNHGPNFWWELPASQILPENIRQELNLSADNIEKGLDILDIWLDSGLSWSHVLGEDKVADMYLEGVDQFTGWFQSSLMTSVALRGKPPYKTVFVHGFAVDSNGHKMSKSLGNVINPQDIVNGGNNKMKDKPYGVDVLRWWVAGHATQHANVPVSKSLLDDSQQCVQKIRSVLRFLLGAIHDAHVDNIGNQIQLYTIDKYMLHLLYLFQKQADSLYNSYQYNRICAMIVNFITNEVSAGYLPITKDRLYCDHVDSNGRRAVQSTMNHVLNTVLHVIAPVVPVLAEEVYLYHPFKKEEETLFQTSYNVSQESWVEPKVEEVIRQAFSIKGAVVKEVPMNSNNLNMSAVVSAEPELYKLLKVLQNDETSNNSELVELLQISSVTLIEDHNLIQNHKCNQEHHDHCHDHSHEHAHEYEFRVNIKPVSGTLCERCRRNLATLQDNDSELCNRCHDVLSPTFSRSNVSP